MWGISVFKHHQKEIIRQRIKGGDKPKKGQKISGVGPLGSTVYE